MTTYEIKSLAERLMHQHGLHGWTFKFDGAAQRLGSCRYRPKLITFSRHYTHLEEAKIRDVLLHEIAHALTPGVGHGWRWRDKCREIGARPERCASEQSTKRPRYTYRCPNPVCSNTTGFYRKPRIRRSCGKCSPYAFNPQYLMVQT